MDPLPLQVITHPLYLKHPDEFLHALHLTQNILQTDREVSLSDLLKKGQIIHPEINQNVLAAAIRLQHHFILHPPPRSGFPVDEILWDTDIDL